MEALAVMSYCSSSAWFLRSVGVVISEKTFEIYEILHHSKVSDTILNYSLCYLSTNRGSMGKLLSYARANKLCRSASRLCLLGSSPALALPAASSFTNRTSDLLTSEALPAGITSDLLCFYKNKNKNKQNQGPPYQRPYQQHCWKSQSTDYHYGIHMPTSAP